MGAGGAPVGTGPEARGALLDAGESDGAAQKLDAGTLVGAGALEG